MISTIKSKYRQSCSLDAKDYCEISEKMPMMELENLEKLTITKKTPFRFLSGVFKRNTSTSLKDEKMLFGNEEQADPDFDRECCSSPELIRDCISTTPHKIIDIGSEMENLHRSRQDNPYLQASCEALADSTDDTSLLSPGPGSPRTGTFSPGLSESLPPEYVADHATVVDLHAHLVRSPPPVTWPNKMFEFPSSSWSSAPLSPSVRSPPRPFSPESGSDGLETERSYPGYSQRSQSEERIISPCPDLISPPILSPSRGQTPALSPGRGQTPDSYDLSPPPAPQTAPVVSPRYQPSYHRSTSQTSHRLRSRTPDEEFSPTRFNIYTLHQRGANVNKSESSYLMTSPGQVQYQPVSRRSLAQLASGKSHPRKYSTEQFFSWMPSRRSRSRSRTDAKSMENLQSPTSTNVQGIRPLRDSSGFSHKSMSAVGSEGAGPPEGAGLVSPRPPRRRFSGIRKSLSLRQKKAGGGPLYIDIDTQENI